MALVQSTLIIITMLTDVGLSGAVYNSKRHHEKEFMQTAWTLQLLKGCLVALVMAIASYPISRIYGDSVLFVLLLVASATVIVDSFRSTAMLIADKQLNQKPRFIAEICTQTVAMVVMIIIAYYTRSVWALMAGHAVATLIRLVFSYTIYPGPHIVGFRLERTALHEIFGYGKWIFLSSALYVFQTQADVMIMGLWMPLEELGFYAIATVFASLIIMLTNKISGPILHPYYNNILTNHTTPGEKVKQIRNRFNFFYISLALLISGLGQLIIEVLYDDRYISAGWMLQLLAFGRIGTVLSMTIKPYLLAKGDSFGAMKYQFVLSVLLVVGLCLGGAYYGTLGLIIAYAYIPIFAHIILLIMVRKHGLNLVKNDVVTILFCFAFSAASWFASESTFLIKIGLI
jgi:O-antigen/teichoic acid export membrane protein